MFYLSSSQINVHPTFRISIFVQFIGKEIKSTSLCMYVLGKHIATFRIVYNVEPFVLLLQSVFSTDIQHIEVQ